jgi:4-amino-4-deoxy-L-arabinose transferase-like glycosyltransferase
MNVPYTASPSRGLTVGLTIAIAALAAILLATFWVGFIASDDIFYIKGAYGWLEQFPFVGKSHWELRHTMTLPLAALIKTFGLHEWVLGVPTVLAFFSFLAINAYFTTRFLNGAVATVATVLMLMAPGITVVATYLIPDVPEMLIVTTAFWLLVAAREEDRGNWAWVAIGALCGLGYLNRQTAAVLPVFAALLFLFKPGVPRSRYLVGGLAFVLVAGGEWLYLTLMTGDPLYRTRIDFTHDPITRTMELAHAKGGLFDGDGNIAVNVFIDPVLNLVISQKYPLLFWLAVPSAIAAWGQRRTPQGRVMMMVLGFGLAAFFFVGANPKLLLVKRYFMLVAWAMALTGAWGLVYAWNQGRRKLATAGLALAVLAGAAALSVERTDPRGAERALVSWVQQHPGEIIYTSPEVRIRADYYFRFADLSPGSVIAQVPPPGSLYFYCAECVQRCISSNRTGNRCGPTPDDYRPKPQWLVQQKIEGQRKPIARLIAAVHLDQLLPPELAQKLMNPSGGVAVYRLP